MKLLKNISGQTVQLYLGTATLSLEPNATIEYTSVVISNPHDANFNLPLIESYQNQNILTTISEMPLARTKITELPKVIVNFSPAIPATISYNSNVQFINLTSVGLDNVQWTWTFVKPADISATVTFPEVLEGGLNINGPNVKDPLVLFSVTGVYDVTLTAIDTTTGRSGTLTKTGLVTVV